jgi:hypothetical protein
VRVWGGGRGGGGSYVHSMLCVYVHSCVCCPVPVRCKTCGVAASVAEQMALGACRMFESDIGLATTGEGAPRNP